MNLKLRNTVLLALALFVYSACDMEIESLELHKPFEYDEQYYENLRAYKESDHCIFFGWFAAYAPLEGVGGYKDPASWGERILGLPDSVDIISFWMGVPGNDPNDPDSYAPIAYADWKFVREKKGTRFVATTITRIRGKHIRLNDGTDYVVPSNATATQISANDYKMCIDYAQMLVEQADRSGVDGIDIDYEPEGDPLTGTPFTRQTFGVFD